ncbi:MAG: hypothetical protein ACOCVK_00350 [bacterium]
MTDKGASHPNGNVVANPDLARKRRVNDHIDADEHSLSDLNATPALERNPQRAGTGKRAGQALE